MKLTYVSKGYKIANNFKDILEKKLQKLEKYFSYEMNVKVNCSVQNKNEKLEVTINSAGTFFRTEVVGENMYNNIDTALPKIERQILKHSGKYDSKNKKKTTGSTELIFLTEMPKKTSEKVVKTKKFDLEPLSVFDAQKNMDALEHNFYIFLNEKTNRINVLYKRKDSNLGLIEVNY